MLEYFDYTGGYPNNPEDYISVPHPGLVNHGPVTRFDHVVHGTAGADNLIGTSGNDTYIFGRGDGKDLIRDSSGTMSSSSVQASALSRFTCATPGQT